ncbi:methyltransferase domain-containing protein [Kitasatospora sp. NPDC058184]|uniref:methyltransferase domain-containing protein n=1 Tax=Kitasatospora sp. NPDC058184 TaxID=3346370 RepID=UPI0036DB383D
MTESLHPQQAASRGLLRAISEELGRPVPSEWKDAITAVPRHRFLPERIWLSDDSGDLEPCDIRSEPDRWFAAAYANAPVVTQVNDGEEPTDGSDAWPSSSASSPAMVVRMLEALDVRPGQTVLEVGTGTGWNAALLAHRAGPGRVVSIEIDPAVTWRAHSSLNAAGVDVEVACGDGALGWARRQPYDRVVSTCSVSRVPTAWIEQTRPGGTIVTPWESPMLSWGLLTLTVEGGRATGRFSPDASFMLMRGQRIDLRIFRDVVRDNHEPEESTTRLSPWQVSGEDLDARFALGLKLGDVWTAWQHEPDAEGVASRLWVATTDARSWAAVDHDDRQEDRFAVRQYGPRRLWTEIEDAHAWWEKQNRPGPDRFGLRITGEEQLVFLDEPTAVVGRVP